MTFNLQTFKLSNFMETTLKVGFSAVDITPPLGTFIPGYFKYREAKRILDPLEARCVAFSDGENTALLIAIDSLEIEDGVVAEAKAAIAAAAGVSPDAVFLHATHTHTGGDLHRTSDPLRSGPEASASLARAALYVDHTVRRLADAALFAVRDMAPATLSCGRGAAPRISFPRRYLMKDGSLRTNPGVGNPDIAGPAGTSDDEVQLLRIDREGRRPVAILNFQTHPDVVGGESISADWPGFARRIFETALGGEACAVFVNGAQGDVNHVCVDPRPGELNGLKPDFDDVHRGYDHSRHMGRVVACAALSVWDKCAPLEAGPVRFGVKTVEVPSHAPRPEELDEARHIAELHRAGRDAELPFSGMALTTAVADAERKLRLEHGPASFALPLSALAIGRSVAFAGYPGEPFTEIGRSVKTGSPFALTVNACLANGARGYFPSADAYAQGGYESRTSDFGPAVASILVQEMIFLLLSL